MTGSGRRTPKEEMFTLKSEIWQSGESREKRGELQVETLGEVESTRF